MRLLSRVGHLANSLLRNPFEVASGGSERLSTSAAATRDLLGARTAKRDLVDAARSRIGRHLERRFRRYVAWLQGQGYAFASCEEWPLRLDTRRAYLRYDVHVRDLLGAFVLAQLHEELQIPGSFQICWEHSRAEAEASDLFLKLQAFDSRFVQFGFHCSPESSWIIWERHKGRSEGLEKFAASGAACAMIGDWLSAFEHQGHDAPLLVNARERAEEQLAHAARSFRRHFGPAKTISGHGTPLGAAYLDAVEAEPRLAPLGRYLHAVEFLTPERVQRHGFAGEITRFDEDALPGPPIMFENPISEMAQAYRQRLSGSAGFVVLFHPATWTSDHFQPFIEAVTARDS